MTGVGLMARLRARGVEVWRDGEILRYRAPEGALTPELRGAIKQNKSVLLDLQVKTLAATTSPGPKHLPVRVLNGSIGAATSVAAPWPAVLSGLGRLRVGAFTHCADCPEGVEAGPYGPVPRRRGAWTFYGNVPLCRLHALARAQRELE